MYIPSKCKIYSRKSLDPFKGGAKNCPMGRLTLQTRELKYDIQGTISAKDLQKICFSPSDGASMLQWGAIAP